jgi:hypothetical protein
VLFDLPSNGKAERPTAIALHGLRVAYPLWIVSLLPSTLEYFHPSHPRLGLRTGRSQILARLRVLDNRRVRFSCVELVQPQRRNCEGDPLHFMWCI